MGGSSSRYNFSICNDLPLHFHISSYSLRQGKGAFLRHYSSQAIQKSSKWSRSCWLPYTKKLSLWRKIRKPPSAVTAGMTLLLQLGSRCLASRHICLCTGMQRRKTAEPGVRAGQHAFPDHYSSATTCSAALKSFPVHDRDCGVVLFPSWSRTASVLHRQSPVTSTPVPLLSSLVTSIPHHGLDSVHSLCLQLLLNVFNIAVERKECRERQDWLQTPETEAALCICSLECSTVQKSKVWVIVQQKGLSLKNILSPVTFFFKDSHNKGTGENTL